MCTKLVGGAVVVVRGVDGIPAHVSLGDAGVIPAQDPDEREVAHLTTITHHVEHGVEVEVGEEPNPAGSQQQGCPVRSRVLQDSDPVRNVTHELIPRRGTGTRPFPYSIPGINFDDSHTHCVVDVNIVKEPFYDSSNESAVVF